MASDGNGVVIRLGKIAAAIFGIGLLMYTVNAAVFAKKDDVVLKIETERDKRQELRLDMVKYMGKIDKALGEIKTEQKHTNDELIKQNRKIKELKTEIINRIP